MGTIVKSEPMLSTWAPAKRVSTGEPGWTINSTLAADHGNLCFYPQRGVIEKRVVLLLPREDLQEITAEEFNKLVTIQEL